MERLERQQTQLELDALWDAKLVKAIPQHMLEYYGRASSRRRRDDRAAVFSIRTVGLPERHRKMDRWTDKPRTESVHIVA